MSKSTLNHLEEYLDTTEKSYWQCVLLANMDLIALNTFKETQDYIDAESLVYDHKNLTHVRTTQIVKGMENQYLKFDFEIAIDSREDQTEQVHVIKLHKIVFEICGSSFEVTNALRQPFIEHMCSTGLNFILS